MANITALYRTSGKSPSVVWGFPPGASIVDLVPEDMKGVIHPHWKSFPPVIFKFFKLFNSIIFTLQYIKFYAIL